MNSLIKAGGIMKKTIGSTSIAKTGENNNTTSFKADTSWYTIISNSALSHMQPKYTSNIYRHVSVT